MTTATVATTPAEGRPTTAAPLYSVVASPLGDLLLVGDGEALTGLYLPQHRRGPVVGELWRRDDAAFTAAAEQLAAYFAGDLRSFDLVLAPGGTAFQTRVWMALREIPYGRTVSYRGLAESIGHPTAARAVGMANGRNPISIVVPCHRVIGAGGALTGYAGGVPCKEQLLGLETRVLAGLPH